MSDRLAPAPLELAEALDRIALQKLAWAYCHAIDRRDLKLVRSLYHDDAVDDHGAMFRGSPDEYVAWLPSMLTMWQATSHIVQTKNFVIAGDAAEGELVTSAWHRTADGTRDFIAHGRYLDRYLKRDGVWKFYRRSLVLDWSEEREVQPSGGAVADGVEIGRPGADDPVGISKTVSSIRCAARTRSVPRCTMTPMSATQRAGRSGTASTTGFSNWFHRLQSARNCAPIC